MSSMAAEPSAADVPDRRDTGPGLPGHGPPGVGGFSAALQALSIHFLHSGGRHRTARTPVQ